LAAVTQNQGAFDFAAEGLKTDRDFVLAVVTQNWHALGYVGDLRGDREIVLAAVTQNPHAWIYASEELRADREFHLIKRQRVTE